MLESEAEASRVYGNAAQQDENVQDHRQQGKISRCQQQVAGHNQIGNELTEEGKRKGLAIEYLGPNQVD